MGPIEPPNDIVQGTKLWASKVSLAMLNFVPEQDRTLDKQLIDEIRNPEKPPLKALPGYTLKSYQTPTGGGSYWWLTNNIWTKWVGPVQQYSSEKRAGGTGDWTFLMSLTGANATEGTCHNLE